MEFLVVIAFFGYIYYLRNYADLRTRSEKEEDALSEGITRFEAGKLDEAYAYFDSKIRQKPKSCIAYLYRGLCDKGRGNAEAAFRDITTGLSFDDQVYTLHLELGKLYLEQDKANEALIALNKAISLAGEQNAAPYRWRAQALLQLNRQSEAQADLEYEKKLSEMLKTSSDKPAASNKPFFDKRIVINMVVIILTSALLLYVVKNAESIHLPYLIAVFSAISIGFAEPYKGWLLAVMQCVLLLAGYFLFTALPDHDARQELENFSLYGAMILTFAASFLGGFLKRALNMK